MNVTAPLAVSVVNAPVLAVALPIGVFCTPFEALTMPAVTRLPPVRLPVTLRLVPVAAPILGVVRLADVLTTMLPVPSNAVVVLSTLALITVPFKDIPAAVLAV